MTDQMKTLMHGHDAAALDVAPEGARRATGGATSSAPPPDPEVAATAKRRQFSASQKRRILAEAERCTAPGQIGALLRREGIYSSNLTTWRKQREAAEVARIVGTLIDTIGNEIKRGRTVQITGFGTFSTVKRKARKGRNPKTGEPIKIAAMTLPKFSAGKALKDLVSKKK
jgi:nucleoid DNA-binding protein